MSATVPYSLKSAGTTAATSVASFTAPSLGDTLLAMIAVPTANAPATAIVDDTGYDYLASPDLVVTGLNSHTYYFVRRSNISGSTPSSISVTGTAGSFSALVEVARVTGLASTSPVESTFNTQLSSNTPQVTHTHTYTTLAANVFVWAGLSTHSDRNLISASNGFLIVPTESGGSRHHVAYKEDAGAIGTYTTDLGLQGGDSYAQAIGVIYKTGASGPTVSTITIGSVTEGGAASVTVALSAATSASTDFACGLAGVTATGADLTLSLNGVTCTNGVTCDGSNFTVPSGVSDWSFNVQTTADTLDEANETATLTIGGISQTLTITDDDAAPTISVNDATENAGEVIFTVSLSAASGKSITVDYATANGTSTAGVDYTAATGTLTFAAGETTKTVTVTVP